MFVSFIFQNIKGQIELESVKHSYVGYPIIQVLRKATSVAVERYMVIQRTIPGDYLLDLNYL